MMTKYFATLTVAALAIAPAAWADQYNFSFNGGGISTSGTLTVSQSSTPGWDDVTGITGTFTDTNDGVSGPITGMYLPLSYTTPANGGPAFTTGGFSYDDTFYPGGDSPANCPGYPFSGGDFDVYGVAFNIGNGGDVGVLWSDGNYGFGNILYAAGDGNATTILDNPNAGGDDPNMPTGVVGSFSASAVPEPGSLMLLGAGLFGMLAALARKNIAR